MSAQEGSLQKRKNYTVCHLYTLNTAITISILLPYSQTGNYLEITQDKAVKPGHSAKLALQCSQLETIAWRPVLLVFSLYNTVIITFIKYCQYMTCELLACPYMLQKNLCNHQMLFALSVPQNFR